jgi:hypothetical protein
MKGRKYKGEVAQPCSRPHPSSLVVGEAALVHKSQTSQRASETLPRRNTPLHKSNRYHECCKKYSLFGTCIKSNKTNLLLVYAHQPAADAAKSVRPSEFLTYLLTVVFFLGAIFG